MGALIGALLLAGCTSDELSREPASTSTPTSSAAAETPTPQELAAESATGALRKLLEVTDQARQEPTAGDWEPEIRRYAVDPAAFLAVQSVRDFATIGLRQDGDTRIESEVADV
jgi:hypothetical protein